MADDLRRIIRNMGYLADSQGVIHRYINTGGSWDEHLQHTKKFILQVLSRRKIRNLAVLGSGWLLDFPLEEVVNSGIYIQLYDVVHPAQILHKIRKYPKVKATVADVTGGALSDAWDMAHVFRKTGEIKDTGRIFNGRFVPEPSPDFVISLNILSQVADIVTGYLKQHIPLEDSVVDELIKKLQEAHMDVLKPGYSCLITDITEKYYDDYNNLQKTKELIKCSLPISSTAETWEWNFDPSGEYMNGLKTTSVVIAMEI